MPVIQGKHEVPVIQTLSDLSADRQEAKGKNPTKQDVSLLPAVRLAQHDFTGVFAKYQ